MSEHPAAERGREARRRLLAAAVELVPEVGWEAVSTRMLAEQAGVAPGLVHYHFTSVDDLLRQATLGLIRELLRSMRRTLAAEPDLDSGLREMLAFLDPYTGVDPTSLLFLEAHLASTRHPELRAEFTALVAEFTEELARWLDSCDVPDPEAAAGMLGAVVDGLLLHRELNPRLTPAAVLPLLERMLRAPSPFVV